MSNLNSPQIFWLSFSKYYAFALCNSAIDLVQLELNLSLLSQISYVELVSLHTLSFKRLGCLTFLWKLSYTF